MSKSGMYQQGNETRLQSEDSKETRERERVVYKHNRERQKKKEKRKK